MEDITGIGDCESCGETDYCYPWHGRKLCNRCVVNGSECPQCGRFEYLIDNWNGRKLCATCASLEPPPPLPTDQEPGEPMSEPNKTVLGMWLAILALAAFTLVSHFNQDAQLQLLRQSQEGQMQLFRQSVASLEARLASIDGRLEDLKKEKR